MKIYVMKSSKRRIKAVRRLQNAILHRIKHQNFIIADDMDNPSEGKTDYDKILRASPMPIRIEDLGSIYITNT